MNARARDREREQSRPLDEKSLERAREIAREHGPPSEDQQRRIRALTRAARDRRAAAS